MTWSYWTYERNLVWVDPVALWEDNARTAPGKSRVHANLAKAYHARGEDRAAEQSFRRALAIDPTMTRAYVSLANLDLEQGRLDDAIGLIEAAREREPDYAPAQLAMGLVLLRRGDFRGAIHTFEDVLEGDESNQAALFNLATAHFTLGDYDQAVTVLQRGQREGGGARKRQGTCCEEVASTIGGSTRARAWRKSSTRVDSRAGPF